MRNESRAAQIFGAANIRALLFFHNNKDPREAELWLREILTATSQLGAVGWGGFFFFPTAAVKTIDLLDNWQERS